MNRGRLMTVAMWTAYGVLAFLGGALHSLWPFPFVVVLSFLAAMRTLEAA